MMSAGATPNETLSTSESSSAPNRVPVFDARAIRPSSASRMPREDDEPARPHEIAARGRDDRPDAEEQVAEREPVRSTKTTRRTPRGRGGTGCGAVMATPR